MPSQSAVPTKLVPLLIRREFPERDELAFVPTCAGCGEPIRDLFEAIVCVEERDGDTTEALVNTPDLKITRIGTNAVVYHFDCDTGGKPFTYAQCVFRRGVRAPRVEAELQACPSRFRAIPAPHPLKDGADK
jgi:hypothetical protein